MEPYRAKRKDTSENEWVYGYYGIKGKDTKYEEHCIMVSTLDKNASVNHFYFSDIPVDPGTVCFNSGIKDIYKNDVFQHDILRVPFVERYGKKQYKIGVVEWENGTFSFKHKEEDYGKHFLRFLYDIEVIGNIFDNADLLN